MRAHVTFGVVDRLAVPVLLGSTFIDGYVRPVHLAERKFVPYYSPPVPILLLQEARSAAEKNE